MKHVSLLPLLAAAAPAFGQTEAYLDQTTFVTNDGYVHVVDPAMTFQVPHPGHFRGRVSFVTQNFDPGTGQYVQPNLAVLWSVRNVDLDYVGKVEWLGDDGNQTPLNILYFDPSTGFGQAQLDIPVAQFVGEWTYAPLPQGGTTLLFAFGEYGFLDRNEAGWPINYQHYASFGFDTDYPDLLPCLDDNLIAVGERVQVTMLMHDSVPVATTLRVDVIGDAKLRLEDGGPVNSWTLNIPAQTTVYALDLIGIEAGTFFVRATLGGSTVADGPWGEVSDSIATFLDEDPGDFTGGGGDGYTEDSAPRPDRYCRPGSCEPADGDKEINCTRPFVELVEKPINPDCGSDTKGYLRQGGCLKGEEECVITGTEVLNCPKYQYAGTVDRSCGQVEVGLKIGVEGQMNWIVVKAKTSAEFHTTVMSPITRRCCKFVPVPGETAPVRTNTCETR